MSKLAKIIIYNHRYDQNIPVLEELFLKKFSNIFHIVPHDGNKSNVISVYENSKFYSGYIAQSVNQFYSTKFEHYMFIGDDLILNPVINEQITNHF